MPVHDCSGSNQDERLPPPRPECSQRNPEQLVQGSQSSAGPLRVQCEQLPTESQVFEGEVLAGAKRADDPPEEMSERHNHGKNIIRTIQIQLCAKSFILRMYDVLARHNLSDFPTLPGVAAISPTDCFRVARLVASSGAKKTKQDVADNSLQVPGCGLARADRGFPLVRTCLRVLCQHEFFEGQFTFEHFDPKIAPVERKRAKAGGGREECLERSDIDLRTEPECAPNRRVAETGQCGEQRVAGHGARVVVATLVFVPRITDAAVITTAKGLDEGEPLMNESLADEV